MNKLKDFFLLTIAYSFVAFIIAYNMMGQILFNLNTTQLDLSGDGFKNYFTFAYHYKYGDGLWFEGMQYPYGDLLMYADAQPAVLMLFKLLQNLGIDLTDHLLGIIQILPVLGIVIAGVLLHKIMRHYHTGEIWTFITVVACLALSPQLHRFNAHYALAYLFCIPAIWYTLLKYDKKEISGIVFLIVTVSLLFVFGYIHPYHILINAVFLLAWFFVNLFSKKIQWTVLAAALLPVMAFMLVNSLLDPFEGRPENPYGVWHYKTEVSDLLPFYGWFTTLFEGKFSMRSLYHEGYSYLGILLFVVPFLFIYQKIKGVKIDLYNRYLWAAFLVLLFGMGIHLMVTNKMILEWLPPLKQFRSLGRFSWAFYYVGFITFSAYFYKWANRIKKSPLKITVLACVVLMWCADAFAYGQFFKKLIHKYKAIDTLLVHRDIWDALEIKNISADRFQAILPMPISAEGAEKYTPKDDWFVKMQILPYSYQTGLPIVGAYMSRISLPNIFKAIALTGSVYSEKEIAKDIHSEKPFLMVLNKEDKRIFSDQTEKAKFVAETKALLLYEISPETLFEQQTVKNAILDALDSNHLFYDDFKAIDGLLSSGGVELENDHLVLIEDLLIPDSISTLTASIWSKINTDAQAVPVFHIIFKDANKKEISSQTYRDLNLKRAEVFENWVQYKNQLRIPENTKYISWYVKGGNILFDHALITSNDQVFIKELNEAFFIYDHYIVKAN